MSHRIPILLADGTIISVQASSRHHCSPPSDAAFAYTSVDINIEKPNDHEWNSGTNKRGEWTSTEDLMQLIIKGGGIVGGQLPPLDFGNKFLVEARLHQMHRESEDWWQARQEQKRLAQQELEQQIHDAGYPEGDEEE